MVSTVHSTERPVVGSQAADDKRAEYIPQASLTPDLQCRVSFGRGNGCVVMVVNEVSRSSVSRENLEVTGEKGR